MKRANAWASAATALLLAAPVVLAADAGDRPDAGTPALSVMAGQLEGRGYQPIVEMNYEHGRWEVEAYQKDRRLDLLVDAVTGEILDEHEDTDDD